METKFLFPDRFKKIGWFIFIPALILGIYYLITGVEFGFLDARAFALIDDEIMGETQFMTMVDNNLTDELIGILLLIGALLVAFSKEKDEDEFIMKIRLESLLWATFVNVGFLLFCLIFVYGMMFFTVMMLNMYSLLILFIIRFNVIMFRTKKQMA
jgi:small-conductance mechanosensitive channel